MSAKKRYKPPVPVEPKQEIEPRLFRKLTLAQRRLIKHPPTPRTWVCTRKIEKGAGTEACGFVNSGLQQKCVMCGGKKPSKPILLWPDYLVACEKAGITPRGGTE